MTFNEYKYWLLEEVECPNCAHHFNINVEETKKKRKKSSELNLKPTQKVRKNTKNILKKEIIILLWFV